MKNTFFTLLLLLFSIGVSAQDKAAISTEAIAKGKSQGVFEFVVPNSVDEAQVAEAAAYYPDYFTVDFDKKKHIVTIKLTKNEEMNKHVIQRFLLSINLEYITIENKQVRVDQLYDAHLKSEVK